MKRILITGLHGYIGTQLKRCLDAYPQSYQVESISLRDEKWQQADFSHFDCVFHAAGIAHADRGKIPPEKEALYRSVNTDLTIAVGKKAKAEGVPQMIYMSSAIVYGVSAPLGKQKMITRKTPPAPVSCYGQSKLLAEQGLKLLESESFRVCILRPPMIYGPGCKGNYPLLAGMAKKLPLFPLIENQRSMLYVGNLTAFIRLMIDHREHGIFWPQNAEYITTCDMVRQIAAAHGKKIHLTKAFNFLLPLADKATGLVSKAFGSLTYEKEMSAYPQAYQFTNFADSIVITEGKSNGR